MKRIWVITLFTDYYPPFIREGVVGQALSGKKGEYKFEFKTVQLRDYSLNSYNSVDDTPYGGGAGMVMRADVWKNALINGVVIPGGYGENFKDDLHVIYTSPRGRVWNNDSCKDFAKTKLTNFSKDLVFICGRYEGIDERFLDLYVDEEICVGDFVFTGGDLPVLSILDSAFRFVPGVLGNQESAENESFQNQLLEYPQYTKPREFDGVNVPDVMVSGHHANIVKFQMQEQVRITKERRPDLYLKYLAAKGEKSE